MTEVKFHCAYVGRKRFRLEATPKGSKRPGIQLFTELELARFAKTLVPEQSIEIGDSIIDADNVPTMKLKEYVEMVLDSYNSMIDKGIDPDKRLKELEDGV